MYMIGLAEPAADFRESGNTLYGYKCTRDLITAFAQSCTSRMNPSTLSVHRDFVNLQLRWGPGSGTRPVWRISKSECQHGITTAVSMQNSIERERGIDVEDTNPECARGEWKFSAVDAERNKMLTAGSTCAISSGDES